MDASYTGNRILALRKEKGWTQKELAQHLHVSDKAVSKWERGINYPDLSLFEPLAQALDTTVSDLLGLKDDSQQEVLRAASEISEEWERFLRREFRMRSWITIICCAVLLAANLWVSKLFYDHGFFGRAQALTAGMSGIIGVIAVNSIYYLIHNKKIR